jgi:hypothetical protein
MLVTHAWSGRVNVPNQDDHRPARAGQQRGRLARRARPDVSRNGFGRFYREAGLTRRVAVWSSAGRCVQAVGRTVTHGVRLLIFNPVFDEAEQLDRVASERVPTLASA